MKQRVDEPVRLEAKRYAFLPEVFVWRGQRYQVRYVDRCWTVAQGVGICRVERRYFRVRCDGGTFEIYHDLRADTWHVNARYGWRKWAWDRLGAIAALAANGFRCIPLIFGLRGDG